MFRTGLFMLLITGAAFAARPPAPPTPMPDNEAAAAAAQTFYAWVLAHPGGGLPRKADLQALQPLLSPQLSAALQAAEVAEDGFVKASLGDEKPPLFEGDMFVDNLEGASEVVLAKPSIDGATAKVEARLFYVDPRYAKAHPYRAVTWADRAVLVRGDKGWLVDNIEYASEKSLRAVLAEYAEHYQRTSAGKPGKAAKSKAH